MRTCEWDCVWCSRLGNKDDTPCWSRPVARWSPSQYTVASLRVTQRTYLYEWQSLCHRGRRRQLSCFGRVRELVRLAKLGNFLEFRERSRSRQVEYLEKSISAPNASVRGAKFLGLRVLMSFSNGVHRKRRRKFEFVLQEAYGKYQCSEIVRRTAREAATLRDFCWPLPWPLYC